MYIDIITVITESRAIMHGTYIRKIWSPIKPCKSLVRVSCGHVAATLDYLPPVYLAAESKLLGLAFSALTRAILWIYSAR